MVDWKMPQRLACHAVHCTARQRVGTSFPILFNFLVENIQLLCYNGAASKPSANQRFECFNHTFIIVQIFKLVKREG